MPRTRRSTDVSSSTIGNSVASSSIQGGTPPVAPAPPAPATAPPPPAPAAPPITDELTRALSRHWKVAALIVAVVTLLAWLLAAAQPKRYQARSIAAIAPRVNTLSVSETFHGVDTLERRVVISTVAALASTPRTLKQAAATSDEKVDAQVLPTTNLFSINVESGDPRRAALLANSIPDVLSVQTQQMYKVYGVTLISPASTPSKAALPRVERAVIAGLVAGAVLAVAAAWILERLRRPVA
jgi:capsular polysaccharide biosynthesis protein